MHRVLFVCLGNICRSPTAEGVFRAVVEQAGLSPSFEIDSAGTGDWHVGEPPDPRMRRAAEASGYKLKGSARQVTRRDLDHFDLVLAMDRSNAAALRALALPSQQTKIVLFREYEADHALRTLDVPDPYYRGPAGFREVVTIIERCCVGLLEGLSKGVPPNPSESGRKTMK